MSLVWSLVAVPFLIALNAFFVAAEYAVVALRGGQIEDLRKRGWRHVAGAVSQLQARPASAIGTIQVCITMTNLLLGWIGEPAMSAVLERLFGPLIRLHPAVFTATSTALSFLVVTLLTVVFSELLPKALTLRFTEMAALLTALPVLAIQHVFRPLVWLMNGMADAVTVPLGLGGVESMEKQQTTAEELRLMAAQAAAAGMLTPRERLLVLNGLTLGRRAAREIMVPRTRVAYVDLQHPMEENRRVIDEYLFSRVPVCDGGLDNVVGIVHTKEFLSAYHAAGDSSVLSLIARPPVFVPERVSLDRLLATFREQRTQMAFLVDEYGGVEGIVTLTDVVDELVGEIRESEATPGTAGAPSNDMAVVPGEMSLHDVAERFGPVEWPTTSSVSTIGGLVVAELGRIPLLGEQVDIGELELRVVESDQRAVRRVQVRRRAKDKP